MADKVDVMFVVGGKNSANTTQLTMLCRSSVGADISHRDIIGDKKRVD